MRIFSPSGGTSVGNWQSMEGRLNPNDCNLGLKDPELLQYVRDALIEFGSFFRQALYLGVPMIQYLGAIAALCTTRQFQAIHVEHSDGFTS